MSTIAVLRRLARVGLAACAALALGTAAQGQDMPQPDWTPEQWNLLLNNAWHTQGAGSYYFRQRWFADYEDARRAYTSGQLFPPRDVTSPTYARNLLEVEPALRFALSRLFGKGDLSPPLRNLNAAGEPNGWIVLELTERGDLRKARADESFKRDARKWIQRGWMATPDVLAHDATEQARRAYWPVHSLETLAAVPTGLSADLEFGDGSTPLTLALAQRDLPLAKALFARGASVHRCGRLGCPLTTATLFGKEQALEMVDWLLTQGARPDQRDPRCLDIADNPLSGAALTDNRALAERLIKAGAAVDGTAQELFSPLEFAVLGKRQAWAQWLREQGASALPREGAPTRNLASYAALTRDAALRRWAETEVLAAAERHPRYRLDVAVEQGGQRLQADARGVIALKPAPFELVFTLPAEARGVAVGASQDAAWLDEVRARDSRNALFSWQSSGALLSTEEPGSDYLLADHACAAGAPQESSCGGAHMFLATQGDRRRDFHAVRGDASRPQHVRRVQSLLPLGADGSRLPVQRLAGQSLHLAVAIPVPIEAATGVTQLLPQVQTLVLRFAGTATPAARAPQGLARPAIAPLLVPHGWVADALGCRFEAPPGLARPSVRWSGDCRHHLGEGRGELQLDANGQRVHTYVGSMKGGRFSGAGVLVLANGVRQEGNFVDGQLAGHGQMSFPDGATGSGGFVAGQLTGSCTLTWPNGDRYDGQCRNGWPTRSGQILFGNGDKYRGAIGQGQALGQGRYTWAAGDVYEGEFVGGEPAGAGEYRFKDGSRYTGNFRLGIPWGRGRVQLAQGTAFEGDVDHGRPGTPGRYTGADGQPLAESRALRDQLQLRYSDARRMTPSWTQLSTPSPALPHAQAHTICPQMPQPDVPSVNWAGTALLRLFAEVRGGQTRVLNVDATLTPPDPVAAAKFVEAVKQTVTAAYTCTGDHLFEQEFEFKIE